MRGDDEQLESLKEWWDKNGKSLIAGVVIAIVGVGGWKGWENYQISQAESASSLYAQLSQLVNASATEQRDEQAHALITQLTDNFSRSVYADYARLIAARLAVENEQLEEAKAHLQTAMDATRVEAVELVARLRLARILHSLEQHEEALGLLNQSSAGGFTAEYEALRGDLLMATGNTLEAQSAYQRALEASQQAGEVSPLVEMKLSRLTDLGDA